MKVKLVRDKVKARGPQETVASFNSVGGIWLGLCAKLHEEASEIIKADTAEEFVEEVADLLTVMQEMVRRRGSSWSDVLEAQKVKDTLKGSFRQGKVFKKGVTE